MNRPHDALGVKKRFAPTAHGRSVADAVNLPHTNMTIM